VTILGSRHDRIVWGRLCMGDVGRSGGNIDQVVRRMTTTAWLFMTAGRRWRLPWLP
jgi:hypothetical protein